MNKSVVITGSKRGIGYSLAAAFLEQNCAATVAPVLAGKILKNQRNGATIAFTSPLKLMLKFFTAPFNKRDLFSS